MGQQVVTVTRIGQRRTAIDVGCGGEVGGPAKPDDRHGFLQSRQRLRHQHDPTVIWVLDGDRAVLGPVGILRLHRQVAELGQPGGNLLHLGPIVEIEHEPNRPAARIAAALRDRRPVRVSAGDDGTYLICQLRHHFAATAITNSE